MENIKPYLFVNGIKLYPYRIYRNNVIVERNVLGWRTALAHARKYITDLFTKVDRIEIVNLYTGEVLTLEQAEEKVRKFNAQRLKERAISATT